MSSLLALPGARVWKDGLVLAALALLVLPLLPAQPLEVLGGLNLRGLVSMLLLIMAMQAAGQFTLQLLSPRRGLLASGFVSGFVSSTASVASLGSQARAQPPLVSALAGASAMSASATWLQALLLSAALSPGAALALLPAAMAGAVGAMACGVLLARRAAGSSEIRLETPTGSALRPREALLVVLMLAGVALLVGAARRGLGDTAAGLSAALAGLVDAHAPIASLAALYAAGSLSLAHCVEAVVLAISANTLTRCGVAFVAGGRAFALRVSASLLFSLALAWLLIWFTL